MNCAGEGPEISKPTIYITRRIPEEAKALLEKECEVRQWDREEEPVPRGEQEREAEEADGLFCLLTEGIDRALLERARKLRAVSTMSVGFNHVDLAAASEKGIVVANTPDVLTETTADLTFALLLAASRRVVEAADELRSGRWRTWSPMYLAGQDVWGRTLGIIGLGKIGKAVARRALGFSMNVLYSSRTRRPEDEAELGIRYAERDELLRESDFVCVLTPYTEETRGMIGRRELERMKPGAVLVNSARGGIVDETALYEALRSGRLAAAGLDVFEREPVPMDHPLLQLPQVTALPHIGSATRQTRTRMAVMAAENLIETLKTGTSRHAVNVPSITKRS